LENHGISENISEVSENLAYRRLSCIRFITDGFFAGTTRRELCFLDCYRGTKFENVVVKCSIIDSNPEDIDMQKILVLTAAMLALLTSSLVAQAADLPQPMPAAPPVVMPYVYDWTGFYVGGNAGYGSSRDCWGSFAGLPIEGCSTQSGGLVGGQGGYRWQMGSVVFGVEAEGDWTNMRGSIASVLVPGGTDNAKVTSVGLFTGQIGYAWNAALLYLKGGAALTNNNFLVSNAGGVGVYYFSSDRWGASVGVGFEYGFTPNWSAGLEYDHLFMGNANNSFSCYAGCAAALNTIGQSVDMVTVRVNYKFGGPVVARY
jgi:outer membrane immunogenic protein